MSRRLEYRLERRVEVGRFIMCFVDNLEVKSFCLLYREGKGAVRGWVTLADKL